MKVLAVILWILTAIWLVLGVLGALAFQELYGELSGLQVFAVIVVIALVPGLVGWWLYRRAQARPQAE